MPCQVQKEAEAAKQANMAGNAARAGRDAELMAKRLQASGGAIPKGGKGQAAPGILRL